MEYAKDEVLNIRFNTGVADRNKRILKKILKHKFLFGLSIFGLATFIWYIGMILKFIYTLNYLK